MSGTTSFLQELLARDDCAAALAWHPLEGPSLYWSFHDLQLARRHCVEVLQDAGLQRGQRVLLCARDLPHSLAVLFAVLDLGACLVPLHPDQDAQFVAQVLQEQQPVLAIRDAVLPAKTALAGAAWPTTVVLDPQAGDWLATEGDVVRAAESVATARNDDSAIVFHSSGSTGRPKALYYGVAQLDAFLHGQQRLFSPFNDEASGHTGPPTPRVNVLPLSHWGGLSFCLQALSEGRCVHLPERFDAPALLALVQRCNCRLLMLVPAMVRELAAHPGLQLPASLRYCLTMGEAMPRFLAAELQRHQGLIFCTAYGMSEALSGLAHGAVPWHELPYGSCGQHVFGDIRLVDEQGRHQPLQGPASGELWVRNVTTRPCYRDATLLQQKYCDGWYRSGDRFRRDAAGHYFFEGRIDGMCVQNGRNAYPWQLESVFSQHVQVAACIAAPVRVRHGLQRLAVALVPVAGQEPDLNQLLDYYLAHGAHYAAPVFTLLLDSLPAGWNGKPDRTAVAGVLQQAWDAQQHGLQSC